MALCLLFPTYVGMNRTRNGLTLKTGTVPHIRGDEPAFADPFAIDHDLFPTYVGMNRNRSRQHGKSKTVPHIRGDEPFARNARIATVTCSPHTWG